MRRGFPSHRGVSIVTSCNHDTSEKKTWARHPGHAWEKRKNRKNFHAILLCLSQGVSVYSHQPLRDTPCGILPPVRVPGWKNWYPGLVRSHPARLELLRLEFRISRIGRMAPSAVVRGWLTGAVWDIHSRIGVRRAGGRPARF